MNRRDEILRETNGMVGDELKYKLYTMFSPMCSSVYKRHSYGHMRRILYSEVCKTDIYGGHSIDSTPTHQINCEHVWPQSFFKGRSPMKSDMNHCFASQSRLNTHRSNKKFDEIDDDEAEFLDTHGNRVRDSDDESDVEDYCEKSNYDNTFEPIDVSKGNIARAIAYFNTMYPKYNLNQVIEIPVLLQWHQDDPVDDAEKHRVDVIHKHQHNLNPFIVCPELVSRVYHDVA
jgi:endonuclease I